MTPLPKKKPPPDAAIADAHTMLSKPATVLPAPIAESLVCRIVSAQNALLSG
jgi:hypothetical protein